MSALRELIAAEIRARGPIPFSRYMELCLYHPELGYYARAQEKFGKAGDFYTSSDVHAVFGRLLCRQFDQMWRLLGSPARLDLVELGPGRGLFAQDVLDWAQKRFPDFHRALRYWLVEGSPSLRLRLERLFAARIAAGQVAVARELPPSRFDHAVLFANEFFDALPVEVLAPEGRLMIRLPHPGGPAEQPGRAAGFVETFAPPPPELLAWLDRYGVHPEPQQRVEAAPLYRPSMQRMAGALGRGFCVIVDYGYTRAELLAGRHRGTLTAIRSHTVSRTPYEAPGEQDITAHVNFTALAELGREFGLTPSPLVTQAQFLLGIGEANQFADAFAECRLPQERAKVALQLKHLVTPAGMGETFGVLVLTKDAGAAGLSGLSWASR